MASFTTTEGETLSQAYDPAVTGSETSPAPCVWLTGRRGAGKRTIGALTAAALRDEGRTCAVLDAADLADHLAHGPHDGGLPALAWLVGLLTDNGVPVIVTADVPRRAEREAVAALIPGYVEVWIDAPAEVCAARSGIDDRAYEEPIAPDRRVPTDDRDARASAALLHSYVEALLTR